MQGVKNLTPTAANLVSAMARIDNNYYPEVTISVYFMLLSVNSTCHLIFLHDFLQTLHRMFVVNAGGAFKKVLWPAAMKFLDPKTIAKIHVKKLIYFVNFSIVCQTSLI